MQTHENQTNETIDLLDAAREVGVHPTTIRRAIRRGELPAVKVFGKLRLRRGDLASLQKPATSVRIEGGR